MNYFFSDYCANQNMEEFAHLTLMKSCTLAFQLINHCMFWKKNPWLQKPNCISVSKRSEITDSRLEIEINWNTLLC